MVASVSRTVPFPRGRRSFALPAVSALLIALCFQQPAAAQTPKPAVPSTAAAKPAATTAAAAATTAKPGATEAPAVPESYRSITLGMDMDAVKEALLADSLFGYRGERDVSLLPTKNRSLIETVGLSFIKRSWFQFYEEKLYIMTFNLDSDLVDYYSIYSALVEKYGEPVSIDPRKAVWSDDRVTLSLERPLTVKYVDSEVFKSLLDESGAGRAAADIGRENFISEF